MKRRVVREPVALLRRSRHRRARTRSASGSAGISGDPDALLLLLAFDPGHGVDLDEELRKRIRVLLLDGLDLLL